MRSSELLRAGCGHMRKAFDIEDLNVDDLIATAMDDPQAVTEGELQFRGMNLGDLHIAYKQFCKNETVENSPVNIANVIEYYNRSVANLPDHARLRGMRLPGASQLLDGRGQKFSEVFEQDQRRVWLPLAEIPAHVLRRVHRGRGQAVPAAPRHRRTCADPRLHRQPDPVRAAAGRARPSPSNW